MPVSTEPRTRCSSALSEAEEWLIEAKRLVERLESRALRFRLHYVSTCGSTQDVARSLAEAGASEGTVVVAEEMKSGRGRAGRFWYAPPGGLWFTLVLRPRSARGLHLLAIISSLSVARAVEELCGLDARVKWPNDVVIGNRKLSGSLVEVKMQGSSPVYALLGVGVNVNNSIPAEVAEVAISLKQALGRNVSRAVLLSRTLELIDLYYSLLQAGSHDTILGEWKKRSAIMGRRIKVELEGDRVLAGTAIDINSIGSLLVRLDSGDVVEIQPCRARCLRVLPSLAV